MQYKIFFVNCGKCKICREDKSARPHGPFLKLRVSRTGGKKQEAHIGRWRHKDPLPPKQCPAPGCGQTFTPKVAWAQFCSDRCRVRAHYHANKLRSEHLGNESQVKKSKKEGKKVKKKQENQDQPAPVQTPAVQPAEPAPPAQPAPTLAAALLAVIEAWHKEHGLTDQQFEDALAEVWQSWPKK